MKANMAAPKKIVDVAHPGQSAPSGNSKSVIITRRPVMADPMMKEAPGEVAPAKSSSAKPKLQPLTAPTLKTGKAPAPAPDPEPEAETQADAPPATGTPATHKKLDLKPLLAPITDAEPETDAPAAPETAEKPQPSPATGHDTSIPPDEDAPPEETKEGDKGTLVGGAVEDEEAIKAKADAELQKLVDSKKYFLPINSREKQRTKRLLALGVLLSLVLIAAWFDIALDAGLLHIEGVKPLTHFFSS
jgi:hypothetical protein